MSCLSLLLRPGIAGSTKELHFKQLWSQNTIVYNAYAYMLVSVIIKQYLTMRGLQGVLIDIWMSSKGYFRYTKHFNTEMNVCTECLEAGS